ncbi:MULTISPECIES: ATP-binding protein [unclassified Variovorax]|uniref:ATP-binding protein n=1 Tax=unclassified Variovorax TaxID=663243 RepID=UPI003ECF6B26
MLLEDGLPVRLGSRAFDLLTTLVERAGEVISNAELIARVWPNVVVEPGALRVHLAGLRKVLGDGREGQRYIVNVPLQGYCFVAVVTRVRASDTVGQLPRRDAAAPALVSAVDSDAPMGVPLPAQVARLIGREEVVADLLRELPLRRCITLVGPAGMGKTTVALAAARQIAPEFAHHAVFITLAPLNDTRLVIDTVISALGVEALAVDPLRGLLAYLRERRLLIVLDNCEHVIAAAAELAEALLAGAPGVYLLATSREPLRIQGEWVQRLDALKVPPTLERLSTHDMMRYSAVELFVERVRAGLDRFELGEAELQPVVEICRSLDGIPLALELAAAGVERLGVRGVAAHLGNRMALLTRGRRTALPRHQTLRAALDWSYALLSSEEQVLLCVLSIFRGRFTREGALDVMRDWGFADVDDLLYNLVSKSLLTSDISGEVVQYWLLETTREYAAALLESRGETGRVAQRHAEHMLDWADAALQRRAQLADGDWLGLHAHLIEDVRAALQWSISARDIRLGVALAGASAPLWFALSRMAEYLGLVESFIERLEDAGPLEPQREFALYESVGHALWNTRGASTGAIAAFQKALHAAERANVMPDQMRALWGLWLVGHSAGDYPLTLHRAEQFGALASLSKDPANEIVHHRMMTLSTHYIGRHAQARRHAQAVLDRPLSAHSAARNSSYHFDQRTTAFMTMARILWVHGFPDQALAQAECAIERARSINHSLSLCFALSIGCCPVAYWCGDLERAQRYTHLLQSRSKEYSLTLWGTYGEGYGLALGLLRGEPSPVVLPSQWSNMLRDMLCTVHPELADASSLERGLGGRVPWNKPEVLRVLAARARRSGDIKTAERLLNEGLKIAAEHEALSWSLRCAMDLADMLHTSKSAKAARSVLAPVYESFSEGWETADLKAAATMLKSLA